MFLKLLTMASHLNPPNWQSHVCNFSQLIRDIKHACLTRLLCMKVEIYQLPTLPTSLLRTSSPTSDGLLAPNGSFWMYISWPYLFLTWFFSYSLNSLYTWGHHQIIAYRIINSMYFYHVLINLWQLLVQYHHFYYLLNYVLKDHIILSA